MKTNLKTIVCVLTVVLMLGAPLLAGGVLARKPAPTPPPEPTGDLVVTSTPELVLNGGQYVRLYDWDSENGVFKHTWSGTMNSDTGWGGAAIGDLDDDGAKEIVAFGSHRSGKGNKITWTPFMNVWWAGDASDSPTLSLTGTGCPTYMDICDIDRDGGNELIVLRGGIQIWKVTQDGYTKEATLSFSADMGLTEADADNDGQLEIVVAFYGDDAVGAVIEYDETNGYTVANEIRPSDRRGPIDDLTVGDLDGDGANEIFGSGYMSGKIYIWRYTDGEYEQIWTTEGTDDYDQSNEIADIDGDGINEFMFCEYMAMNLVVYKYDTTAGTWGEVGTYSGCPGNAADEMVSWDWDGDGAAELVAQNTVWEWDGSGMVKTQTLASVWLVAIG